MPDQFSALRDMLAAIPPERMAKLKQAHRDFVRLRSLCVARGYIEVMPKMVGITVLKKAPEVKELKKIIDFLQPKGFKWEGVGTTEKSSKKSLAGS